MRNRPPPAPGEETAFRGSRRAWVWLEGCTHAAVQAIGLPVPPGAGLTIAIALLMGMLAQSIALRLSVPGIVLLLFAGLLLGPDVAGWVQPQTLGVALPTLVGFAVAVVLFEGAMNLELSKMRREKHAIRMLVSVGGLITIVGATLTVRHVLGWDWRPSVLFGTLVVVTGPTVVTPLLRRVRIESSVATILEAEAVFGDAIGAVVAVAAYEFAAAPFDPTDITRGILWVVARLGFGGMIGVLSGGAFVALLRTERVVPRGLENVFTLTFVLAQYQLANSLLHESGIAASIGAGIVVGNVKTRVSRQLHEFKEGLTVMLIGLLFVLLAADVRFDSMWQLGWPALLAVALLMLAIRPLAVFVSTLGSGVSLRQRLFISWLAPRGIIAASVASLFAVGLDHSEMLGASALREMVFLVIFATVCSAGLTGGPAARWLGVERPNATGWVVLGASAIARVLASELSKAGQEVLCIDTNPSAARAAEESGLRIIYGNGLEELTLRRAEAPIRLGFVALTQNEEVNLLFAERVRHHNKTAPVYVTLNSLNEGVTRDMVKSAGARVLFGGSYRVARWLRRFEQGDIEIQTWARGAASAELTRTDAPADWERRSEAHESDLYLPLLIERGGRVEPFGAEQLSEEASRIVVAVHTPDRTQARDRLVGLGWQEQNAAGVLQHA